MSDEGTNAGAKAAQGQVAKALTMAKIMKKKRGVTKEVVIQLDGELATKIDRQKTLVSHAQDYDRRHNVPDTAPGLVEELEQMIEDSMDTEVTFIFKSMGRVAYDELVSDPAYQADDEQKKEGAQFDPDTFPAALVAGSCLDPEITLEEAEEIFSDPNWNGAELQRLFFGALEVNTETGDIPLSKGATGATANSLLSLITQQNEESPTPSS